MGKYVDFLNDVSTGNYETAVSCEAAKYFFSCIELINNENSSSLDAAVLAAVKSFTSAAVDEEETVLKLVVSLLFFVTDLLCICRTS